MLAESGEALDDGPILVWGAAEGVELALDLARGGRKVRLLDPRAKFAPAAYIGSRARYVMLWAAQAELVPEIEVELVEVGDGKVALRHGDGREESVSCAHLVVAPGRVAHDPLSAALLGSGIEVHIVGDARSPRSYGNAIHEAAYLARRI